MFSFKERAALVERLQQEEFDLLIIGGGITGAGVALQAAASGLKTALIEMQDFAAGTSSRSTKLVHGGIRYLKTFDVGVVADTVSERAVIQGIAPHIPKADPMLLPIYDEAGATFDLFSVKVAMDLYDRLAGIEEERYFNYLLTKEEVLAREPQLQEDGLLGGGVYLDYCNNDARLVIENIKTAAEDGAVVLSRVKAESILHDEAGRVNGVSAVDLQADQAIRIRARYVINTSGPWSDLVTQLDDALEFVPRMRPTKGVHLVVDRQRLQVPQPTYFDTGKADGRMIFVIPRENKTYFGTTDTDYTGDLSHPVVTAEDVHYLLEVVNGRFPHARLTLADIEASWAGLRPLIESSGGSDYNGGNSHKLTDESFEAIIRAVQHYQIDKSQKGAVEKAIQEAKGLQGADKPSAISRGSELTEAADGLLILAGGKLTDYRLMAKGALEKIASLLEADGTPVTLIDSAHYPVSGGHLDPSRIEEELLDLEELGIQQGLTTEDAHYLAQLYGSNAAELFKQSARPPYSGMTVGESIGLDYALQQEMVLTPVDYFLRRTNYMLFINERLEEIKEPVLAVMSEYFDWSAEEAQRQRQELEQQLKETRLAELKQQLAVNA